MSRIPPARLFSSIVRRRGTGRAIQPHHTSTTIPRPTIAAWSIPSPSIAHCRPFTTTLPSQLSRRPTLPHPPTTSALLSRRTIFIQTESTPNPDALKFLPGQPVLPPNTSSIEFLSGRTSHSSPLARKLFALDGITSVFYGPDFITVTKSPDISWAHLKPEVFSIITETLNSGGPILLEGSEGGEGVGMGNQDTAPQEGDTEVVSMIKELLDTRIRPAIQEDGGDIEYRGFEEGPDGDGMVRLKLRGACRTCDSSTVTLKNGIESMLMHYIEEVKGVIQVVDPEEEVALKEFERFEERLRKGREREVGEEAKA